MTKLPDELAVSDSFINKCYIVTIQGELKYEALDKLRTHIIQTVYDTDTCTILDTASYSTNTYKLTPLEALIHDASNMNNKSAKWLVDLRE
jgi:16S rRNA U516 pseudouridylate synthase RsuA-like enzyme